MFFSTLSRIVAILLIAAAIGPLRGEKPAAPPAAVSCQVNSPNGVFKIGEPIELTLTATPGPVKFMEIRFTENGVAGPKKVVPADRPHTITARLDKPGWIAAFATPLDADRKPLLDGRKRVIRHGVGAVVAPEQILPARPAPADFQAFWQAQRAELERVPLNAVRREIAVVGNNKNCVYYDVKVPCAGNAPVSGYLGMPRDAKPKSLPAIVLYQGAGVRSAGQHPVYAAKAITFDINAHGIDNGKPAEFYADLQKTTLKNYPQFGAADRNTVYFKNMYLRVLRALDYVKSLPEWDGKTLIVYGGSQGGGQAIVAAALDPAVTLCVAQVPALGDHAGGTVGRKPGWPTFYSVKNGKVSNPAVAEAAQYFDNNYFAASIRCPIYLSTGFIDMTCAPTSVYTVYNSLPAATPKSLDTWVSGGHSSAAPNGLQAIRKALRL